MKKTFRYLSGCAAAGVIVMTFLSCGTAPMNLNGEWVIQSGDYFRQYTYDFGEETYTDETMGTFKSGKLFIKNQEFDFDSEVDGEDFNALLDQKDNFIMTQGGSGYIAVYAKEGYLTLFFDTLLTGRNYENWDQLDLSTNEQQASVTYAYEITSESITLTRSYLSQTEGATEKEDISIFMEKK